MTFISTWFLCSLYYAHRYLHSFPTRRSSDLVHSQESGPLRVPAPPGRDPAQSTALEHRCLRPTFHADRDHHQRSEEHTSELQSRQYLVCRLLLEKKNNRPNCI